MAKRKGGPQQRGPKKLETPAPKKPAAPQKKRKGK